MPRDSGEDHHLWMHGSVWYIRINLPRSMGAARQVFPTGTADVRIARKIRDRVLGAVSEEVGVVEIARQLLAVAQRADAAAESFVRSAGAELGVALDSGPKLSVAKATFNRVTIGDWCRSIPN